MTFSNIFSLIRRKNKVAIAENSPLANTSSLAYTTPLAQASYTGLVMPQGIPLTRQNADILQGAVLETSIINPIVNMPFEWFTRELRKLVNGDVGYHRNDSFPNFTRFRLAFESNQGIAAVYQAFLNSEYAMIDFRLPDLLGLDPEYRLLDSVTPTMERRVREFYRKYRGVIDIPSEEDIENEDARLDELQTQGILTNNDLTF